MNSRRMIIGDSALGKLPRNGSEIHGDGAVSALASSPVSRTSEAKCRLHLPRGVYQIWGDESAGSSQCASFAQLAL